jgi:hypothetical protein
MVVLTTFVVKDGSKAFSYELAFREIELPAVAEVLGETGEQVAQDARTLPLLKPPMAGLVRRV